VGQGAADGTATPGVELIMVAEPGAQLRLHGGRARVAAGDVAPLNRALDETAATPRSLFGPSEERVQARRRASPWNEPDLSLYYRVHLDVAADHEAVARRLTEEEAVAGAYVKPAPVLDAALPGTRAAEIASPAATPAVTPDFTAGQHYLDPPTDGVDARTAWNQPGGDGTGVDVVLVGGAWQLQHEDLHGDASAVIAGTQIDSLSFRNHGTAMLGVMRADRNAFGVTGIAPGCRARQVATFGLGTAGAINAAANAVAPGAVIVIEWQRPGPGSTGVGSAGFIAIEWWPDDFAAVLAATAKGVIVVAPAGNGGVSLDDPTYSQPLPGFPPTWTNPFARGAGGDSGSIIVGAGAPPTPPAGSPPAVDRSRLDLSNYGTCVDVQGWGSAVTTLGYGDLQGGTGIDETIWYTGIFGGTSAAAAIAGGVVTSLQGVNIGGGSKRPPLTPAQVRQFLRATGSPQQAGAANPVNQSIGSRPALMALIGLLPAPKSESKDGKDNKDTPKENKDTKDTKDTKDNKDNPDNKTAKDNKDTKDNKDGKDHKDHKDDKGDKTETPKELKDGAKEKESAIIEPAPRSAVVITPVAWPVEDPSPVQHFIPIQQRPNLVSAALLDEPDAPRDRR
jgi:hypothetical protein